jgi:hypothetical protein
VTRHAGGGRRSRGRAEDRSGAPDVGVHTGLGDAKEARDLFRRKAAGDGAQHLTLTIGQPGNGSRPPIQDAAGDDVPRQKADDR